MSKIPCSNIWAIYTPAAVGIITAVHPPSDFTPKAIFDVTVDEYGYHLLLTGYPGTCHLDKYPRFI
ncbi:hypothetical protein BJX76DRAFT_318898 [Aspergillus varians]